MELASRQRGPIAVYGATGFTGRLVARELERSGADFILAGRNRAKLEELAASLDSGPATRAVPVSDGEGLRDLFEGCATVIACAGPFTLHGEPVLEAAVATGSDYLDTTGEQPFIRLAYDTYGPKAASAGTAVIPAMGFDYVPGDMIASLTATGLGRLDTVRLAYATAFQMTRGTMLSALEMIKGGDLEWRGGRLEPAPQKVDRGRFEFDPPLGGQPMTRYPAGEHLMLPRHLDVRNVETMLSAGSIAPGPVAELTPLVARPAGILMRTPVRKVAGSLISRLPEGPDEESRRAARFTIACEARAADGSRRRGRITGNDVYGITAAMIAKGAIASACGDIEASGGLSPAQAFDPNLFLDGFGDFALEWSVDPVE